MGEQVKRDYTPLAISGLIAVLIAGFTAFLSTFFPGSEYVIYGLGGLVAALTVIIGYVASSPH